MESWDIIMKYMFIPAAMFFVCNVHLPWQSLQLSSAQPFARVLLQTLDSLSRVISDLSDNTSEHFFPQPHRSLTGDAPILHLGSA